MIGLCKISSRSNMTVRNEGSDTDFGYVCTVTLTLHIWPLFKVMTHPWITDNNCVNYYKDQTWEWRVRAQTRVLVMCPLWPWPWRYDLSSRSWHTLGSRTTIVWITIKIQLFSTDTDFRYVRTVTLTLEIWTWVKVMTHPWDMDTNCVQYYPDHNLAVRSYGLDTDFGYVCTVTLTLEISPWLKLMTRPWVMNNNCVKYYPDKTRFLYPLPNFVCGSYNKSCQKTMTLAGQQPSLNTSQGLSFSKVVQTSRSMSQGQKSRCVCEILCPPAATKSKKLFLAK